MDTPEKPEAAAQAGASGMVAATTIPAPGPESRNSESHAVVVSYQWVRHGGIRVKRVIENGIVNEMREWPSGQAGVGAKLECARRELSAEEERVVAICRQQSTA